MNEMNVVYRLTPVNLFVIIIRIKIIVYWKDVLPFIILRLSRWRKAFFFFLS